MSLQIINNYGSVALGNPWVSVKDRLPEEHRTCELYDSAGYYRHGYRFNKEWRAATPQCNIPEYVTITYWRYTTPPNKQVL